jgi:hypothetical protein
MALQMNYNHPELGITIYNAYWRINPNNGIIGGKNGVKYTIEVFKDKNLAHGEKIKPIKGFSFSFIPKLDDNASNFIKQAYIHAKSMPMFKGSIDL